jgi:hypothetical protein
MTVEEAWTDHHLWEPWFDRAAVPKTFPADFQVRARLQEASAVGIAVGDANGA